MRNTLLLLVWWIEWWMSTMWVVLQVPGRELADLLGVYPTLGLP